MKLLIVVDKLLTGFDVEHLLHRQADGTTTFCSRQFAEREPSRTTRRSDYGQHRPLAIFSA